MRPIGRITVSNNQIPCLDWSCKLPHEILRTGPIFASFHPLEQIEPIHEDQRAELDSAEAPSR